MNAVSKYTLNPSEMLHTQYPALSGVCGLCLAGFQGNADEG